MYVHMLQVRIIRLQETISYVRILAEPVTIIHCVELNQGRRKLVDSGGARSVAKYQICEYHSCRRQLSCVAAHSRGVWGHAPPGKF